MKIPIKKVVTAAVVSILVTNSFAQSEPSVKGLLGALQRKIESTQPATGGMSTVAAKSEIPAQASETKDAVKTSNDAVPPGEAKNAPIPFCENYKKVSGFKKIADVMKQADEQVGIKAFYDYSNFAFKLDWDANSLLVFSAQKLETIYQAKPFTTNKVDGLIEYYVRECSASLRKDKDYRFFVLNGMLNKYIQITSYKERQHSEEPTFYKWMQSLDNKKPKSSSLFEFYDGYDDWRKSEILRSRAAVIKPVALNSDGSVNQAASAKEEDQLRPLTIRPWFSYNSLVHNRNEFNNYFDGKPRNPIDWSKVNLGVRQDSSQASGGYSMDPMFVAYVALIVDGGVMAIENTLNPSLIRHAAMLEASVSETKTNLAQDKAKTDQKAAQEKLVLLHPIRKLRIDACIKLVEQKKKTVLPATLNSEKTCTCAFDTSVREFSWGPVQLDNLLSASTKLEKDYTRDEVQRVGMMSSIFPKAFDLCAINE